MPSLGGMNMALINFGTKEIKELKDHNENLISELKTLKIECSALRNQVLEKDKKILEFENHIKQIKGISEEHEKLLKVNRDLNRIINNSDRKSKATSYNLKVIENLKLQGESYRAIARVLSNVSGEQFSYSTVRYLYKKYIENSEQ